MRVKLFRIGSGFGKPAKRFQQLEDEVNAWLADRPAVEIEHAHRLSQPTFGWGELALAVWYEEADDDRRLRSQ